MLNLNGPNLLNSPFHAFWWMLNNKNGNFKYDCMTSGLQWWSHEFSIRFINKKDVKPNLNQLNHGILNHFHKKIWKNWRKRKESFSRKIFKLMWQQLPVCVCVCAVCCLKCLVVSISLLIIHRERGKSAIDCIRFMFQCFMLYINPTTMENEFKNTIVIKANQNSKRI